MKKNSPKIKISRTFTLSAYRGGTHRTKGYLRNEQASFLESLSPLSLMIESFGRYPLGTKIKVTMEAIEREVINEKETSKTF